MESEISLKKQPMNGVNIRVHMKNGGWISSNSVIINKFENYLYVVDGKTSDPKNLEVELFLYSCLQSLERRDTQILSIADVRRCENPPIKSGHKKNDNVITSEVFVLKLNPKICIFDMIYISVQTKDKNWTSLVYDNTGCSYNSMPYISSGRVSKPWN